MGSSYKACFFIVTIQLLSIVAAQEAEKRVPHGFFGVRGKKIPRGIDPALAEMIYTLQDKPFYEDEYSKRAPMGFIGMRGKKLSDDTEYVPKRDGSLIGQIDYNSREDVNKEDYPILDKLLDFYLTNLKESTVESNEVEKRAANIRQFYGVRGKKFDKRPYDVSFRGKFIGVRGKKDGRNNEPKEIKFLLNPNEPWPKRKGQMGFFGMRGKKWISEASEENTDSVQAN